MKRIAVVLLLLALPACSSGWSKSGATARDFTQDDIGCYADAHKSQGAAPSDLDNWGWAYLDYEDKAERDHAGCLAAKGWDDLRFPHWAGLYFPFF